MKFLLGKLQVLLKWFGTSILAALGLSFVTYTGVSIALDNLKGYIQNSVSGIPADAYALMIMGGFGHAVGIIFGAFAFRATLAAASKLTALAKK